MLEPPCAAVVEVGQNDNGHVLSRVVRQKRGKPESSAAVTPPRSPKLLSRDDAVTVTRTPHRRVLRNRRQHPSAGCGGEKAVFSERIFEAVDVVYGAVDTPRADLDRQVNVRGGPNPPVV